MITLKDILAITDHKFKISNLDENTFFSSVVIDSRKVTPGSLFVAIKGERFDGHDFIPEVLKAGAAAVVVKSRKFAQFAENGAPVIGAPDTVRAFGSIGGAWRSKLSAPVIGITGSNGKTTTKDILATLLSSKYRTVSTPANNNNHIGVPLTLLEAGADTEFVICEVGTNHFGGIAYSASIATPDHATITNIGDSHIEFLINRSGVRKEKEPLLAVTRDRGGKVYLYVDDPYLQRMRIRYPGAITLSMKGGAMYNGKVLNYSESGLPVMKVERGDESARFELGLYGKKNCDNALIAAAIARECGMSMEEIGKAFANVKAPKGRMNRTMLNGFSLIDDTYNANPESMKSAFDAMGRDLIHQRRMVILGDMFELGQDSPSLHAGLARYIKSAKISQALLTGKEMKELHKALKLVGINSLHFKTKEGINEHLSGLDLADTLVLVKGSRGMKMEVVAESLKERGK